MDLRLQHSSRALSRLPVQHRPSVDADSLNPALPPALALLSSRASSVILFARQTLLLFDSCSARTQRYVHTERIVIYSVAHFND